MVQEIPVFVINLDRRPDRRDFMARQLDGMGVEWERFPAVDAAAVPEAEMAKTFDLDDPIIRMGPGSRGCTLSHLEVMRRVAAGKAPAALVIEDDLELSPELAGFVRSAGWLPHGIGVIRFEKWSKRRTRKLLGPAIGASPVPGRTLHRLHSRIGGSGCHIVTRDAAARFTDLRGRLRFPIDHLLFNFGLSPAARKVGVAMVLPALARQSWGTLPSDISPAVKAIRKPLLARLRRGWYEVNRAPAQAAAVLCQRARLREITYAEHTA